MHNIKRPAGLLSPRPLVFVVHTFLLLLFQSSSVCFWADFEVISYALIKYRGYREMEFWNFSQWLRLYVCAMCGVQTDKGELEKCQAQGLHKQAQAFTHTQKQAVNVKHKTTFVKISNNSI